MHHDLHEIKKFNNLAYSWWDTEGAFKTLHLINPVRTKFIQKHIKLDNKLVIDVGCGGGILCESLSQQGAKVTGIDLAPQVIEVARLHLHESKLAIKYECTDIVVKAQNAPQHFDVVTCMELLEHVADTETIIKNCAKLVKPNGIIFFSTLNRNLKSYLLAILMAEYILKLIPKGTHDYQKFIKPSELQQMLAVYGLTIIDIKGLCYNPITSSVTINNKPSINYIVACKLTGNA